MVALRSTWIPWLVSLGCWVSELMLLCRIEVLLRTLVSLVIVLRMKVVMAILLLLLLAILTSRGRRTHPLVHAWICSIKRTWSPRCEVVVLMLRNLWTSIISSGILILLRWLKVTRTPVSILRRSRMSELLLGVMATTTSSLNRIWHLIELRRCIILRW